MMLTIFPLLSCSSLLSPGALPPPNRTSAPALLFAIVFVACTTGDVFRESDELFFEENLFFVVEESENNDK